MDFLQLASKRKEELIHELQQLIQIESVYDEKTITKEPPFGKGPAEALRWMLSRGEQAGFRVKNVDHVAGHIEMGEGNELIGILCHVDVVPAGNHWTRPPFEGVIEDGKLFGRGAIDDKGPTIAAFLAMKMVKELNIPLKKRVRLIVGTDEESGFRCVEHYFQHEEMPHIGFSPDADFPLINAEKGIALLQFTQKNEDFEKEQLVSFEAGSRINMVPDFAKAIVRNVSKEFEESFQSFAQNYPNEATILSEGEKYIITVNGKSAHAMEPEIGINAAIVLANFLKSHLSTPASENFVSFLSDVFGDVYGSRLQIDYSDEMSGPTTFNAGMITFNHEIGGQIQVSMRYSVTYPFVEKMEKAKAQLENTSFELDVVSNSKPHYVPEDDAFIQTLLGIYRHYTGDYHTPPLSTGGGTYARILRKGVAYGALFPGEVDVAHQKDEYVVIDHLVKAAAIYAEAIVQLAT